MRTPAILALADGTIFHGTSIGADGCTVGEVVFNTAMTGYQEILTDPSYAQQMVTLTYPHIGNTGVNLEDEESTRPWLSGFVVRAASPRSMHQSHTMARGCRVPLRPQDGHSEWHCSNRQVQRSNAT